MSADPLPYAALLKRQPSQDRSAQRVEAILNAAAELLSQLEPEDIAVRDLAALAGVPTGTLYQFFADGDTVMQALALRFLSAMPDVLDAAIATSTDWPSLLEGVVDAYAAMIREHPAIRRLWLSGRLDAATRHVERETDARIAARLGATMQKRAKTAEGNLAQWGSLVALVDGLLRYAFADSATGDEEVLDEAKRAAKAYAAAVMGLT